MFENRDTTTSTTVAPIQQQPPSLTTAMRVQVNDATMPSPQQAVTKASKLPGNANGGGEMSAGASPHPNQTRTENFKAKFVFDAAATVELRKQDGSPIPEPPKSAGPQIGVHQSPLHELSTHASPLSVPPLNVTKGQYERSKYNKSEFGMNVESSTANLDGQKPIVKAPVANLPMASQSQATSSAGDTKSNAAINSTAANTPFADDKNLKLDMASADQTVDDLFGDAALNGIPESDLFMKSGKEDLEPLQQDDIFAILKNDNPSEMAGGTLNNDPAFFATSSTANNKKFDTSEIDSIFSNSSMVPENGSLSSFSSANQTINKMPPPQVCCSLDIKKRVWYILINLFL